jgi:hypothetical protein
MPLHHFSKWLQLFPYHSCQKCDRKVLLLLQILLAAFLPWHTGVHSIPPMPKSMLRLACVLHKIICLGTPVHSNTFKENKNMLYKCFVLSSSGKTTTNQAYSDTDFFQPVILKTVTSVRADSVASRRVGRRIWPRKAMRCLGFQGSGALARVSGGWWAGPGLTRPRLFPF